MKGKFFQAPQIDSGLSQKCPVCVGSPHVCVCVLCVSTCVCVVRVSSCVSALGPHERFVTNHSSWTIRVSCHTHEYSRIISHMNLRYVTHVNRSVISRSTWCLIQTYTHTHTHAYDFTTHTWIGPWSHGQPDVSYTHTHIHKHTHTRIYFYIHIWIYVSIFPSLYIHV